MRNDSNKRLTTDLEDSQSLDGDFQKVNTLFKEQYPSLSWKDGQTLNDAPGSSIFINLIDEVLALIILIVKKVAYICIAYMKITGDFRIYSLK